MQKFIVEFANKTRWELDAPNLECVEEEVRPFLHMYCALNSFYNRVVFARVSSDSGDLIAWITESGTCEPVAIH